MHSNKGCMKKPVAQFIPFQLLNRSVEQLEWNKLGGASWARRILGSHIEHLIWLANSLLWWWPSGLRPPSHRSSASSSLLCFVDA